MYGFARVGSRILGLAIPLLAGCATSGTAPTRGRYRPEDFARLRDSVRAAAAERASEPRVHIITPSILGANRFVESAFRVSEDAYVAIVAVDVDGRARVLFPESPTESGLVHASTLYRLPTFFAGFGSARTGWLASNRYSVTSPSYSTAAGLIFAVASDRPLQLQRLATDDGDWDEFAVERVLRFRSYTSGAYALGRVLTLTGQEFDTDFSGFTQGAGRPSYLLAMSTSARCDDDLSLRDMMYSPTVWRSLSYVVMDGIRYARLESFNSCNGQTEYQLLPVGPVPPALHTPADSTPADSNGAVSASRRMRAAVVGVPVEDGALALVERPVARRGTIGSAENDAATDGRPRIDRGLRFAPPERIGEDGSFRRVRAGESSSEELARELRARRVAEEQARRAAGQERRQAPQGDAPQERPMRADPPQNEPAAVEQTNAGSRPSGGDATERTGKPVRE